MITEIRYIVFSDDELREALGAYLSGRVAGIERTSVSGVEVESKDRDVIGGTVAFHRAAGVAPVRVDAKVLILAMLTRCRERRVPVSATAEKRLERTGGGVAMVTSLPRRQ